MNIMSREEAKDYVLRQEPDFLEQAPRKVNGKATYICPKCGNGGSGKTGDGITRTGNHYHCFVCGSHEDVIGLWKIYKGITDDAEAFKSIYEYYGIEVAGQTAKSSTRGETTMEQENQEKPAEKDYTDFFLKANKDLDKTTYHRGISTETLNRFYVGYVEDWKADLNAPATPRLIIPTSRSSYFARDARSEDDIPGYQRKYEKMKQGKSTIYNSRALWNAKKPIFVVEGQLDALSIIDVGGEAIGLGSISNINKLINLIDEQGKKPAQTLILALDNDENGQAAEDRLYKALTEKKISSYRMGSYIYITGKDANEELMNNKKDFQKTIAEAEQQIEETEQEQASEEKREYMKSSAASHIDEFLDGIRENADTPCIPTGFSKLDAILDGGLYEGLYIVGAVPSLGKTTFVLQMADQIAKNSGKTILYFTLEMARSELMAKSISRLTLEISGNELAKTVRGITDGSRYKNYSQDEKDAIQGAVEAYRSYADKIFINEGVGNIGTKQIRDIVEQHIKITGQNPVVIIDYLQILAPAEERYTDKQNIDSAVMELKKISRDFKVPLIAISSFNRTNYNKLSMEAFKESGGIEYSADVLIGLQTPNNNRNESEIRDVKLTILKNRNGEKDKDVYLEYAKAYNLFAEAKNQESKKSEFNSYEKFPDT